MKREELIELIQESFASHRLHYNSMRYDMPEKEIDDKIEKLNRAEKEIVALIKKEVSEDIQCHKRSNEIARKELLKCFEEMWASATIGNTWKLNKKTRYAYDQIVALINRGKPKVSEDWIEEKAKKCPCKIADSLEQVKDFIRSLVEEIK